ncbi:hypothetical protein ACWD33_19770 [Streptomyces xiamenensis]|uniref:Uncharacterized protein n=1 Tax=Streptomyces xiamenensis TaxID=408015 RepID=A0A0F7G093_9ACTN|nr:MULTISPECIES: hypothetical protein [Streptomyces]AKG46367.1 hypothetical protein SXIM_49830 [Streptomyces xiamenensis]
MTGNVNRPDGGGGADAGAELSGVFDMIIARDTEPPLGDLASAALAGGRRLRRRRRAAQAVGVSAALVLAVLGVSTLSGSASGPAQPVLPAQSPSPESTPDSGVGPRPEPSDELAPYPEVPVDKGPLEQPGPS